MTETFEQSFQRYPFAPLVRLGIVLGKWARGQGAEAGADERRAEAPKAANDSRPENLRPAA